jgi:hypothetical protein
MIVSPLFGKILIGVIYVAIIALFAFLWKKMKKNPVAGGTIGFFIGIVPAVMLGVMSTGLYIVDGSDSYSEYWVYGSPTYTTAEGEEITIENEMAEWTVINDSEEDLVIEQVIYGSMAIPEDRFLSPGESMVIDGTIHHFFGDTPPDEISTESSSSSVYRLWLRLEDDYNEDYGY